MREAFRDAHRAGERLQNRPHHGKACFLRRTLKIQQDTVAVQPSDRCGQLTRNQIGTVMVTGDPVVEDQKGAAGECLRYIADAFRIRRKVAGHVSAKLGQRCNMGNFSGG